MRIRPAKLLVGIGNVLQRDEGVGVHVAQHFRKLDLPPDVEVHEAGTQALNLADVIGGRRLIVVVDALDAHKAPGSVFRLFPEQLRPEVHSGLSLHDLHLLDALAETRLVGAAPDRVLVVAVQVANVSMGLTLSRSIRAALSRIIAVVARELGLPTAVLRRPPERTSHRTLEFVGAAGEDLPWT